MIEISMVVLGFRFDDFLYITYFFMSLWVVGSAKGVRLGSFFDWFLFPRVRFFHGPRAPTCYGYRYYLLMGFCAGGEVSGVSVG